MVAGRLRMHKFDDTIRAVMKTSNSTQLVRLGTICAKKAALRG